MSTFLLSTMPAAGHLAPFLPLAARLAARGHRVVWHTGERRARLVEEAGAVFVPFQGTPDFSVLPVEPDAGARGPAAGVSVLRRLFVDRLEGQVRDYERIVSRFAVDVVVVDMCCFGAAALHERDGVPFATVGINPLVTPDPEIPPFGSSRPPARTALGRAANRAGHGIAGMFLDRLTPALDEQRRRVGLPRLPRGTNAGDLLRSPLLHLQPATPAFEYPRRRLEPQVHFVGPLIPAPAADAELPEWWADLDSGRPVVHVTQGTYATHPTALLRPAIDGLADLDVLVVAVGDASPAGPLPANVRFACYVSHPLLLPRVDVMVSNGGYNGVLAALAHGVPLVVAGRSEDKPAVCARVAWSGAGIDLRTGRPKAARVAAAVRRVLENPSYRGNARRIQADFASHDAPAECEELLERLARTRAPVLRAAAGASLPAA